MNVILDRLQGRRARIGALTVGVGNDPSRYRARDEARFPARLLLPGLGGASAGSPTISGGGCSVCQHYLSLNRSAPTVSGGETQRIRLASQIGSGLTDGPYVLDEPSIGLHDFRLQ